MNRNTKIVSVVLAICIALVFSSNVFSADVVIKAASASAPDSFHAVCLNKFKALAEKYSNGKIQVNVFLGGSVGSVERAWSRR